MHVRPRLCGLVLAAALLPPVLASCGGDDRDVDTGQASGPSIVTSEALDAKRVTAADVKAAGDGTPRQAFLRFWSSLQSQAWADAIASYDPDLVAYVGASAMLEGFKSQTTSFSQVEPKIIATRRSGAATTIDYEAQAPGGPAQTRSVRFEREDGRWRITYDAYLDSIVRQAAQTAAQARYAPSGTTPSPRAVSAGLDASRRQSQWLESRLTRREPAG